jgi:hypothetical protein
MATHAFDFMANSNKDCWMLREVVNNISRTHTSLLPNFLGWQKATLIPSKCLLKISFALNYSQYCGYITPKLSMTPWIGNLPCKSSTRHLVIIITHIQFVNLIQLEKVDKITIHEVKYKVG